MLVRIVALLLIAAVSPAAAQHSAVADTARVYELADVQIPPSALNADARLHALMT